MSSYAKLQKCIVESLYFAESTTAASIFQPDIGKLTELKDKIMNQLVQIPAADEDLIIREEEASNRNTKTPDDKCTSAPTAGDDDDEVHA